MKNKCIYSKFSFEIFYKKFQGRIGKILKLQNPENNKSAIYCQFRIFHFYFIPWLYWILCNTARRILLIYTFCQIESHFSRCLMEIFNSRKNYFVKDRSEWKKNVNLCKFVEDYLLICRDFDVRLPQDTKNTKAINKQM